MANTERVYVRVFASLHFSGAYTTGILIVRAAARDAPGAAPQCFDGATIEYLYAAATAAVAWMIPRERARSSARTSA